MTKNVRTNRLLISLPILFFFTVQHFETRKWPNRPNVRSLVNARHHNMLIIAIRTQVLLDRASLVPPELQSPKAFKFQLQPF